MFSHYDSNQFSKRDKIKSSRFYKGALVCEIEQTPPWAKFWMHEAALSFSRISAVWCEIMQLKALKCGNNLGY